MRVLLQRVKRASVIVKNNIVGEVPCGLLLFLAVETKDKEQDADWLVKKIVNLKIFDGDSGKSFLEKNIQEIGGEILVVSQFTLYGDCHKGNKPSFTNSAPRDQARELYDYFVRQISAYVPVKQGIFGEDMEVELVNNGPVTLIIDSKVN